MKVFQYDFIQEENDT